MKKQLLLLLLLAQSFFSYSQAGPPFSAIPVTNSITSISDTSTQLNGEITGGAKIINERGFVYAITATNNDPEIGDTGVTKIISGTGYGQFSENLSSLMSNTSYSYKTYVDVSGEGVSYGDIEIFITFLLSTERFEIKNLSFYPNPTSNFLYLNSDITITEVEIFNNLGQKLSTKKFNSNNITINLDNLNSNFYFIKAYADEKIKLFKIIKQ